MFLKFAYNNYNFHSLLVVFISDENSNSPEISYHSRKNSYVLVTFLSLPVPVPDAQSKGGKLISLPVYGGFIP